MLNKKGISGVIVTLILITISLVIVVVVWRVVNNLTSDTLDKAESCFGVFGKVSLNNQYTCYKSNGEIWVSVNIGDIEVDSALVSITANGQSKSFTLTNEEQTIENVANYGSTGFGTDLIKLPEKNSGMTYIYKWSSLLTKEPDSVQIIPIINGKQCEIADTISAFGNCELIA